MSKEIIETEKSYVESLDILVKVPAHPFAVLLSSPRHDYMLLRAEIYGTPGGQRSVGQGRESHHLFQHPFSALNQQRPAAGTSSPPPTHSLPIQPSVVAFAYVFAFDVLCSLLKDLMLVDETTKVTPSGKSFADVWLSTVRRVHWRALSNFSPSPLMHVRRHTKWQAPSLT